MVSKTLLTTVVRSETVSTSVGSHAFAIHKGRTKMPVDVSFGAILWLPVNFKIKAEL